MKVGKGKLGVVVLIVALSGAILGSWALSSDINQVTVTHYSSLADITGLFQTSQEPQYIDYNPSTNYTGYYDDPATKYWPSSWVEGTNYYQSNRANTYKINLEPSSETSSTITVSNYTGTDAFDSFLTIYFNTAYNGTAYDAVNTTCDNVTLASYIAALSIPASINKITIKSVEDLPVTPLSSGNNLDFIMFSLKSWWSDTLLGDVAAFGTKEWFTLKGYSQGQPSGSLRYYTPAVAAVFDRDSGMVNLFYDVDCTIPAGTYNVNEVVMTYGGNNTSGGGLNYINFGDTADLLTLTASSEYLDPTRGVEL